MTHHLDFIFAYSEKMNEKKKEKKGNGTYLGILKIKVSWDSQRGEKTSSRPLIW